MFGWCFASLANNVTGVPEWDVLDSMCTALTPPLALHLFITFVGAGRTRLRVLVAAYVAFGALALSSVAGLTSWGRAWVDSTAWAVVFLAGWTPMLVLIVVLLVRHLVESSDADEKARTRTMLAALAVGGALSTIDILRPFGLAVLHLGPIGSLVGTTLVATAAFRFRLLDRDLSVSTAVYAAALAIVGVILYLVVFRSLGGNVAALAFGTVTITVVLGAAVREVVSSLATQRERSERLAVLGRFSNQMAHDLKNPLGTIKGALQFLQEERARGKSLDEQHEFIDLMLQQVDRLHRVVDDYQRIGRVEPVRRTVDVNEVVRNVVALEPFAAADGIAIRTALADDLPPCALDSDLVSGALENVIRNAFEAMPSGGTLTVRTELAAGAMGRGVVISVEDVGEGMDKRRMERACDEFYTTKPQGSGLGLAFVRRVAHAHGGDLSLTSRVGVGTTVRLRLSAS
jgi:signal transduction histidine kinase